MAGTHTGEQGEFGFQIAPMVDVVFVLLLFFMACAGMNVTEKFLAVPAPGSGDGAMPVAIFVDVDAAGTVSVNGRVLSAGADGRDLSALRAFLANVVRTSPEDPVILRPSGEARHERVLALVDICKSLCVRKLVFS